MSGETVFAEAVDFESAEAYHPAERPGYACWCVLWHGPGGALYLAFAEKRRASNPLWEPVPVDFWESMALPVKYHTAFCNGSKNVITEMVVLRSDDDGKTWTESGRSTSKVINAFAWASLADGSIIRVRGDDYVAFDPGYAPRMCVEVSDDGGTTWEERSVILENCSTYPYRLKRLSDGALALVAPYADAFGPGRVRQSRHTKRPYVRDESTCGVFLSTDDGRSWLGPFTAFGGVTTWEPDFVELPDGDLLLVNSNVQAGPQVRQRLRRTKNTLIPGPVFDVVSGRAPECLLLTQAGLLVGAVRGGDYTCSNDEGATWHKIEGLPPCKYQPYMANLSDGRLLCAWHVGGDNFFGELDQWVGTHTFRLQADLPKPTQLAITRDLAAEGQKYVNAYTATLTAGGQPVAGREVGFAYHLRYTDDYDKADDPRMAGTRTSAVTDENGRAHLDLTELDKHTNMHQSYRVAAWFDPGSDEARLSPAKSEVYMAYTVTMSAEELAQ